MQRLGGGRAVAKSMQCHSEERSDEESLLHEGYMACVIEILRFAQNDRCCGKATLQQPWGRGCMQRLSGPMEFKPFRIRI